MTKQRWIDAGLAVLAEEGAQAVRIDRVATRVGLSKGSFFHHFGAVAGYRTALVHAWEESITGEATRLSPDLRLVDLAAHVGDLLDLPIERAMRAWALQDPEVEASVARVDRERLAALERMLSRLVVDPQRAHAAALIPHLITIGASVSIPALDRGEIESVFGLLAELLPAVRAG